MMECLIFLECVGIAKSLYEKGFKALYTLFFYLLFYKLLTLAPLSL